MRLVALLCIVFFPPDPLQVGKLLDTLRKRNGLRRPSVTTAATLKEGFHLASWGVKPPSLPFRDVSTLLRVRYAVCRLRCWWRLPWCCGLQLSEICCCFLALRDCQKDRSALSCEGICPAFSPSILEATSWIQRSLM